MHAPARQVTYEYLGPRMKGRFRSSAELMNDNKSALDYAKIEPPVISKLAETTAVTSVITVEAVFPEISCNHIK
jgi:hypothetical protein